MTAPNPTLLSAAIRRLRHQAKAEATVLLNAARDLGRHVREALPDVADAIWPERVKQRWAGQRAELDRMSARHRANRLYMAAMSQASQPAENPANRARLAWLALESFREADALMTSAGCRHPLYVPAMQPDAATERLCNLRAMTVQRLEWRGGRRSDEEADCQRTNPHDVLEAVVAESWSFDDLPTEAEARDMVGWSNGLRRPW